MISAARSSPFAAWMAACSRRAVRQVLSDDRYRQSARRSRTGVSRRKGTTAPVPV